MEPSAEYIESLLDPVDILLSSMPGMKYLYPFQKLVVNDVLEAGGAYGAPGKLETDPEGEAEEPDTSPGRKRRIVILPTGAGKSLCFQLPSLLLPKPTLVLYPLVSLVSDQERRLKDTGISCAVIRGGMEASERSGTFGKIASGGAKLVLTTPEAALSVRVRSLFAETGVSHLVVDEAHCVAEWGDSFRPSYLETGAILKALDPSTVSCFTATASPSVLDRVREIVFRGDDAHLVAGNPDRPNIRYSVEKALMKEADLARLLAANPRPAIVFCRSRKSAELTSLSLRARLGSDNVFFYHAGLERDEKRAVEAWFRQSGTGILCATCAYGMGVDKADVRTVIHRDPPPSMEAYLQESGRAGRDGGESFAIALSSGTDAHHADRCRTGRERMRYGMVLSWLKDSSRCRREGLLGAMGFESEFCPGCDVCDGVAAKRHPFEESVLGFVKRRPGRFSARDIALMSSDEPSPDREQSALWDKIGIDCSMSVQDAEECVKSLLAEGILKARRRFLWGGRLECGRSGISPP